MGPGQRPTTQTGIESTAKRPYPWMVMELTPSRDDKFSFGLWTVGYNGADPFGGKGFGFVRVQQLALEHILGAR